MALWKNGAFTANGYRFVPDDRPIPDRVEVTISPERWREERDELRSRNAPIGLRFEPDTDWSDLVADLAHFPVIEVSFPKFADGRSFSIARLLRERDGYAGEIRAVGHYFIDQVPMMRRVGIDAFETDDPIVKQALGEELPEVTLYTQPAFGDEKTAGNRPWARQR